MEGDGMKAVVSGPDDDCDVWLNLDRDGHQTSINLGHPDEPVAHAALEAAGKDADVACTPGESEQADPVDLASLNDVELIVRYETTAPGDPLADRIANEMEARGLEYPELPLSR